MTKTNLFVTTIILISLIYKLKGELAPRIINGTFATLDDAKYVVSIRLKQYDNLFGNGHICGGALIGPNKVLTVAHCLYNADRKIFRKPKEFIVALGILNRFDSKNAIVSKVKSIAYMKTFVLKTAHDNIAVILLNIDLSVYIVASILKPIGIANETMPTGLACKVTGWGQTEKGNYSNSLISTNVTTLSNAKCILPYGSLFTDGMICAGPLLGGTGVCRGDAGGPLVYNNMVIALASFGKGCAEKGYPAVFTNVSYHFNWIMSQNLSSTFDYSIWTLMLVLVVIGSLN